MKLKLLFTRLMKFVLLLIAFVILCFISAVIISLYFPDEEKKITNIKTASPELVSVLNYFLLEDAGCEEITEAYTNKIEDKEGYLVAAQIFCPGLEWDMAMWYTLEDSDSTILISQNATAEAISSAMKAKVGYSLATPKETNELTRAVFFSKPI